MPVDEDEVLDLEAPTAPPGLQENPVTILFIVLVVLQAVVQGLGIGELKDGFQPGDIGMLLGTIAIGILTRLSTFTQATVDLIAPRSVQRRAVRERKAGG